MEIPRTLFSRITALFHTRPLDATLDEELASHIELATEEYVRLGVSEAEARRLALRDFGGVTQTREAVRIRRGLPILEQIRRDVRFGVNQLWRSKGFTLTAVLTLALGIGANTTIFTLIDSLLLRPLPVPESGRLVVLGMRWNDPRLNFSWPESIFRGFEHRRGAFDRVFAFSRSNFQVNFGGAKEIVYGQYVSGAFFDTLRVRPLLGRVLTAQDDRKGGDPAGLAAVISESLWVERFHRDPAILGQRLDVDNTAFTIAGVMPRSFIGADPLQRPQIFLPLADEEIVNGERSLIKGKHFNWWLTVMGRLAPGATVEQADRQVAAATSAVLRETVPDESWIADQEKAHLQFGAQSGSTGYSFAQQFFRKPLLVIAGLCAGILLLACLNIACLLMARGAARQRELATRAALGASRRRLIQQLLVEGLLLAIAGTAAGLAIAPVVGKLLADVLLHAMEGYHLDPSPDPRVFAFAAAMAVLSTLIFALAPAIKATSLRLMGSIKDGQQTTLIGERRAILPRVLLGAEIGLALLLVVGAGLIGTSLFRLYNSGIGFDPHHVENIAFHMEKAGLKGEALIDYYREMGQRLSQLPGVSSVSYARIIPFSYSEWDTSYKDAAGADHHYSMNAVAPGYFGTMRIPLIAGRDFNWNDTRSSGLKIILNQTAAKQSFPDGVVLGRRLYPWNGKGPSYEVIGVVGDAKYREIHEPAPPTAYLAIQQDDGPETSYAAVVRTKIPPSSLANTVRALTAQMGPSIPPPIVTSMERTMDDSISSERIMAYLAAFFALCALAVTAIGLYGTLVYATARRTTEIGIRMALGAQRVQVARMIFFQNLGVVMGGTVAGLAGALLATRALASLLFQTSTRDPWVIAAALIALAATACAASILPALRAARIEPMAAIRCE